MIHDNSIILCISDTHFPYCHVDAHRFLKAIRNRFKPTRVIHLGDELDNSAISFHEKDPDMLSENEEFRQGKNYLHGLVELFPNGIDFIESNHGSLAYRRAKFGQVPARWMRSYNEVLDLDQEKFKWHRELEIKMPNGLTCIFNHGLGANVLNSARDRCACLVQGHYHSSMGIHFFGDEKHQLWAMQLPCLIDNSQNAFDYNKKISKRPKIGAGLIVGGYPMIIPMAQSKSGRFTKIFFD